MVDPTFQVPVRDLIKVEDYVSKAGHPGILVTIGVPSNHVVTSGASDWGFAAVNAIGNTFVLQMYGDFGSFDEATGEFIEGYSTIGKHVRTIDWSEPSVMNAIYSLGADAKYHRYKWYGYRLLLDDPNDGQEHEDRLQALHGEIDVMIASLLKGKQYRVWLSESNSARFTRNVINRLEMTLEAAREQKRQDDLTASAFEGLNKNAEAQPVLGPAMVDGIDLRTLPLPFEIEIIVTATNAGFKRMITVPSDLNIISANQQKIADGLIKVVVS